MTTEAKQKCQCHPELIHCGKLYRAHPNIIGGGGHCMNQVKQRRGLEQCGHKEACHPTNRAKPITQFGMPADHQRFPEQALDAPSGEADSQQN